MRRFKSYLLLSLLFFTFVTFGQVERENSLLWKIEKKGYNTSYLFGTIHIKDKRAFHFNDSLLAKIDASEVLVTELDLSTESIVEMAVALKLPEGKTLKEVLSPVQYEKLKKFAEAHVLLNFAQLEQFKPIMILMLAMQSEIPDNMGEAVDVYLYKYAKSKGKETVGLETIEEQMDVFDMMSYEEIIEAVDEYDSGESIPYEELIVAYENSDLTKVQSIMKQEEAKNEKFMKALLQKRNKVMAKRIPNFMEQASTVFAVGAGHLAGKEGLLKMLEDKGFNVSPIIADKTLPEALSGTPENETDELLGSKFTVEFPGEFSHSVEEVSGMQMHMYTCNYSNDKSNNFLYNLIYYVLPLNSEDLGEEGKQAFFSSFEGGILSAINGEITKKKELKFEKGLGAEIEMSLSDGTQKLGMRVVLQGDACVILQVMAKEELDKSEMTSFYKTLKIK